MAITATVLACVVGAGWVSVKEGFTFTTGGE